MKAKKLISALTAFTLLPSISVLAPSATVYASGSATTVILDPSDASTNDFEGWGTSLCWWANRVGYSESLTSQAAEAFFSDEGLGLDIARYNLGGGDDPTHDHITRSDSKVPGYATGYDDEGNIEYDWTVDENQRNVAKAALAANPDLYFEGFSNSPPYFMTNSGCSSGAETASDDNLQSDKYDDFAEFIATATLHFRDEFGIEFQSYSPMNEPDTSYWGAYSAKQEGCHFSPGDSQSTMITALRSALDEKGLTDVIVAGMDETSIDSTVTNLGKLSDEAVEALGRIDTHTYSGSKRSQLSELADEMGKTLWMSEVDGGWNGFGLADRIILDMNGMKPSAWVMWDIVDSHKDSTFTTPDGTYSEASTSLDVTGSLWGVGMADHDTETLELANKYYAFGQFTRYINPGDTIIASSSSTLAAYNKTSGDIKIVVSNSSSSDKDYVFDLSAFTNIGDTVTEIRSNNSTGDAAEHWAEIEGEATLSDKKITTTAKATTVTTYIVSGNGASDYAVISGGGSEIGLGESIELLLNTNLDTSAGIEWSLSGDSAVMSVSDDKLTCTLSAVSAGTVTVSATVDGFTVSREFTIPLYTLTGTASWSSSSSAPSDDADYLKVADGDLSTYFDGTTGGWVRYDFGTPFKITQLQLAARSGSGMAERTVGGTVQGSNDAVTWTDLYTITSALAADVYTVIGADELADNHAYRYYRYTNNDNMANIAEFLIDGEVSDDIPDGDPTINDLSEFTDNFESTTNIFGAVSGDLSANGSIIYESSLDRFGNVFIPANVTAETELSDTVTLTNKDMFRLTFNMFSGWLQSGADNTFSLNDADGNSLVSFTINTASCAYTDISIGGEDVLESTPSAQCRTALSGRTGANGWDHASQPYQNNVGYNKTIEITIDGNGYVDFSSTGGLEDYTVSGKLSTPVSIKSITLVGSGSAIGRIVSYDNFDGDVITYSTEITEPTATPIPVVTDAPTIPDSGELISLDFNDGDLTSSSSYGKAEGSPAFVTVDGRQCIQFDGTSATAVKLTDANGNSLLTDQKNLTISFKVMPTSSSTSWWFYAAPSDSSQTYLSEQYLGAMSNSGTLTVERYNNSGERSATAAGACTENEWNDVSIVVGDDSTALYINGTKVSEADSDVDISDMLGSSSVAYIGLANWGTGEYATGYLDDFVIVNTAAVNPLSEIDLGDTSALTEDITVPSSLSDGTQISWSSSDESVITAAGVITRPTGNSETAVLTASASIDGTEYTRSFNIGVVGLTEFINTFTAYADGTSIYFTAETDEEPAFSVVVALYNEDGILTDVKFDVTSSSFDNLSYGRYSVTCYVWDDMTPMNIAVSKTINLKEDEAMDAYLFAHFVGSESSSNCEQIYFSVSTDGTNWTTLNSGSPILISDVGELGVRDPYILRGEDGKFFVIATDLSIYNRRADSNRWSTCQTSGSKGIVIWESDDLVNWSEASLVEVADENAGCTWAPEAIYDAEEDAYMVFWASKVSDDSYTTQRIYRSYTKDFKTFTDPELYIDGGSVSNIDTTITSYKGVYYRFTKNESKSSVTMMKCTSLNGDWESVDTYSIDGTAGDSITGYEGPTIYKLNGDSDQWCLLLDYYSKSLGYKPFVTDDISSGVFTSASDFNFDDTYRHGTVMPITSEEYDALVAAYPAE